MTPTASAWFPHPRGKPRHDFIDAGAELTRLYPICISSTKSVVGMRLVRGILNVRCNDDTLGSWLATAAVHQGRKFCRQEGCHCQPRKMCSRSKVKT
jgi:hypothetical protein